VTSVPAWRSNPSRSTYSLMRPDVAQGADDVSRTATRRLGWGSTEWILLLVMISHLPLVYLSAAFFFRPSHHANARTHDRCRYEIRVIAHGEVIAFAHNYLPSIGEQLFPAWLKSEWIIAFSEDRQQCQSVKWAAQGLVQLFIDRVRFASAPQIPVKCPDSLAADACIERFAAGFVHVTPDAESA
jgi:hypothetical protein